MLRVCPSARTALCPLLLASTVFFLILFGACLPAQARQQSSLTLDYETGEILAAQAPDEPGYPASLTKVMTLYLTFQALEAGRLRPGTRLRVSSRAASMPPTKLSLRPGSTISVDDAVMGLITRSANDAAVVLAETLGGSEARFAEIMTRTARRLGMRSTTFVNASGLPNPEQLTTARDMARLGVRLIRDYPRYYRKFSRPSFDYGGRVINNHNHLLGAYEGADGIKTGYTQAAGYNLLASAVRGGRRLIGVVLGGTSAYARDRQMVAMLDHAFTDAALARAQVASVKATPPAPRAVTVTAAPVVRPTVAVGEGDEEDEPATLGQTVAALGEADQPASLTVRKAPALRPVASEDPARPRIRPRRAGNAGEAAAVQAPAAAYGVLIGSFRSTSAAQRSVRLAIRRAPTQLRGTFVSVRGVRSGRHMDYRARLIGLDHDEATAACKKLHRYSQSCSIVRTASVAVATN